MEPITLCKQSLYFLPLESLRFRETKFYTVAIAFITSIAPRNQCSVVLKRLTVCVSSSSFCLGYHVRFLFSYVVETRVSSAVSCDSVDRFFSSMNYIQKLGVVNNFVD